MPAPRARHQLEDEGWLAVLRIWNLLTPTKTYSQMGIAVWILMGEMWVATMGKNGRTAMYNKKGGQSL
jgi:hypothetical protein